MEEKFETGRYMIDPPRPEEDAVSSYQASVTAQAEAARERDWEQLLGENEPAAVPETPQPADPQAATSAAEGGQEAQDGGSWVDTAKNVIKDVGGGAMEAVPQVVGGVVDAIDEAGQFLQAATGIGGFQISDPETGEFDLEYLSYDEWKERGAEDAIINFFSTEEADTNTGGFIRATSQFLTGFLPAMKGAKALGISNAILRPIAAGAVADAVVFDPHEDRLSTFLNEVPVLEPFVSDYLADNNPDNESEWEGRLKNVIEGAGLGLAADGVATLFRGFKYYKAQRQVMKEFQPSAGARDLAARDALKAAAREDLVQDVTDEALKPLGDANGDLLIWDVEEPRPAIEFKLDETEARTPDAQSTARQIVREGQALGTLDFTETDDTIRVSWVEVDEAQRGQGAGFEAYKALADKALRDGKTLQSDATILEGGQALYRKLEEAGYSVTRSDAARKIGASGKLTTIPKKAGTFDQMNDPSFRAGFEPVFTVTAGPKPKVKINHARIQTSDDVKATIQRMADLDADAIDAKRRGVVTNAQTIRESSQEYRDLDDLIGRPPGPMTAAQATAARRLLTASGEQITGLAKKASAPDASPADIYNFRRAMAVHYAIQSEVIAARTETARALQAWAIPAGSTKARSQAIHDLITQSGGAGDLQSLAKAVASVGDNPAALNSMARELGKGKFGRALYQVWINGILSSPKTHMVNILSNAMVAAYAVPERYLTSAISRTFYNGEVPRGEVAAQMFGAVKGIRDGLRLIYHGNKAEGVGDLADVFDAFGKIEARTNDISAEAFGMDNAGAWGRGMDLLGKAVNVPGTMLEIEDKFFKSVGYRMELHALAYRKAASEGLDGEAAAKRVAEILQDPPEDLVADALDVAHYNTFTNELGTIGKKLTMGINSIPGARLVVPFIRTPTNIIKFTFARTPLAYMSGAIRADIRAGGARAAAAHARVALGSMIMLTTADMALEGTITGRGPTDPRLRRTWMAEGNLPYSVKIGGRNYQFSRLDPVGMMMGIGADIAELTTNANDEQSEMMATAAVLALANNLANKTYMTGIYDFIGAIDPNNPTNDPAKYLANFAGSIVPYSSFLRNVSNVTDPVLRETRTAAFNEEGKEDAVAAWFDGMLADVRSQIPGMGADLPPRRDLFGEPINRSSGLGVPFDFLSPVASRVDNPDPVTQVILDNQIPISNPPRNINGVSLNAEQYSEFVRRAGQPLKEHLDKLVKTTAFKNASNGPDGMKAELVRDAVNIFRDKARAEMMRDFPELRELSYLRKMEQLKSLQGESQ